MSTERLTRVNELLRREIGRGLYRVIIEDDVDMARVTVTHVITSPDLRGATVLVSVAGNAQQQKTTLAALARHRVAIQEAIARDVKLKYTPRLRFELDKSLQQGDRVLEILGGLAPEEGGTSGTPDAADSAATADATDTQPRNDDE